MVDEFFAGALEAVGALFEGEERGVADEDGGVGVLQHVVEVGGQGQERRVRIAPVVKEDAGVGNGGAAGGVGCHGAQLGERLGGAADEKQGANAALGSDGASGEDFEAGSGGESGDGDETDVGRAVGQAGSAIGGGHAIDSITEGERVAEGWMLEVPHEGRGIEEIDGGDAQAGLWCWVHCLLDYQSDVKDSAWRGGLASAESTWFAFDTGCEPGRQLVQNLAMKGQQVRVKRGK